MMEKQGSLVEKASFRDAVGWLAGFTVVNNMLALVMPLYMTQVYDRILPSSSVETLVYLSLIAIAALALFGCVETVRQKLSQKLSARYEMKTLPVILHAAAHSGETEDFNLLAQKTAVVKRFISSPAFTGLFDLPFAPLFLAIMFLAHHVLGWLTLVGMVVLALVSWLNQWSTKSKMEDSGRAQARANRFATDALGRIEDVRAMGMGDAMIRRWRQAAYDAATSSDEVSHVNASYYGVTRSVRQALQILTLGTGAYLVITHQMSPSLIFAASIVSSKALLPVEQMIGAWKQIAEAQKAHRDVSSALASASFGQNSRLELPNPAGVLEAKKVTLNLAPASSAPPLLQEVDLTVKPGELVAIIGASGSGKSTLARILAGAIQPTKGEVTLDGFRLDQWPTVLRGRNVGYVGQETTLIEGTVAENIFRFDIEAKDDWIVEAAKVSRAHDFIGTLPEGYNTRVGSGGVRLSGGQVQRVALARALYRNPPVLILDEPNAHLDSQSEEAMLKVLQEEKAKGRAIIVVTHRANILQLADNVLIMDRGRLYPYSPKPVVVEQAPARFAHSSSEQSTNLNAREVSQ